MKKHRFINRVIICLLAFVLAFAGASSAFAHDSYPPPRVGHKYQLATIEKAQPELRDMLGEVWWAANKDKYVPSWFGLYTTSVICNKQYLGGYQYVGVDWVNITVKESKRRLKAPVLVVTEVDEWNWPFKATIYKPKGWADERVFATITQEDTEPWMP